MNPTDARHRVTGNMPPFLADPHIRCGPHTAHLFFGQERPSPAKTRRVAAAKAICADCPLAGDCLNWAIATHQRHGIWGGRDERERRGIAVRRGIAARRQAMLDAPAVAA